MVFTENPKHEMDESELKVTPPMALHNTGLNDLKASTPTTRSSEGAWQFPRGYL